jgi:hypothetical protein
MTSVWWIVGGGIATSDIRSMISTGKSATGAEVKKNVSERIAKEPRA